MATCGIYMIENIVNAKVYIGSSKNIEERIYYHFYMLRNNKHHSCHLQNAFNKYGKEKFKFQILKTCSEKDLIEWEQYYINKYQATCPSCGYNLSLKAGRLVLNEDSRKKISEAGMGRKLSVETRKKISEGHRGKNHSVETKEKMSRALMGKKLSVETRGKISEALKGNKRKLGKNHSAEAKEKMSRARKAYWQKQRELERFR